MASILDGTERCRIAADQRGKCKFRRESEMAFCTVVVAALGRDVRDAPGEVRRRERREREMMGELRRSEVLELMNLVPGLQVTTVDGS